MDKEQSEVWVVKSTGEHERFSLNKLRRSLTRSGADDETITRIINHIIPELHNGMKTSQIYKHAYSILKKNKYPAAIRYSLRAGKGLRRRLELFFLDIV
ncbi:MAG: hypothetical protein UV86_C0031G0006 [Candidatus Nomurabacteria bacterium GW2011_GWB1_43_20]|nr:MAG: hypothetical protein UV86_C0031G0006 [Candidatus Nomurabacteria bacterium GW2011_GWB1_43_20]